MRVKCYSVRVKSLTEISERAVKICSYDGKEDIFPKSQIIGQDFSVDKSEAYWIAAWILEKKSIQYSTKKEAWFDTNTGKQLSSFTIKKHKPTEIKDIPTIDESLKR